MKKFICCLLAIAAICSLTACGDSGNTKSKSETDSDTEIVTPDNIDVDLTKLSSTMVYSEVYNMMVTPDNYCGKTVKMKGKFSIYQDPSTGFIYYAVIIADATACCSQGLEFVLDGNYSYPEDYPKLGTEITVTGEFQTYKEGETTYCHLIKANMT